LRIRNGGNIVDKPFDFPPVKTEIATVAYQRVLDEAGATLPKRDAVDQRVADSVRKGTGRHIDSSNDVGGWPELKSAPPPADTDNDGLPDEWETGQGVSDGNLDPDSDGYTNLEEFLNGTSPKAGD
jgi:hypothetical protein